ncbi:hydrogenase, membrane subunit 2-like protein [Dehalobacter sp. UNSWDHB]|jgi:Hydrogenase 4 membrane component (E)|uniref:NADH-quinone oxidoreductase subunit K n=1 Tax=unclassified Dehalobacter TaxID=2635733 RepID=UPI00028AE9D1|nr:MULTISPECIES: NADH-quinone oxidoreductase subunit K [unclassified Dehalobacter]AFV01733.1 hydrogenase-4 membrane component [Dehalobacter sp. DCA]AFV04771.1 hydrogenase-4 membrane component [Dehalobacter sp. CF]EQB21463.1 hydrogenase, membrane subunit 2-like protein [Dehalobacter sp. UNSWDHB]
MSENLLETLSVLILLSSFVLMANKRISSYIKSFRIQSMLIALAAGVMGVRSLLDEGRWDILIICILIVVLKVIYIPGLLNRTYASVRYKVEKDFILNIPILVLVCCGLVIFSYFTLVTIDGSSQGMSNMQLVNSVSVIWIGLFFMISRKKALGQIIGFLVIENGLYITAMLATQGMPFIVDLGIFIDLVTFVLIMGMLTFRINDQFDSIDTDQLNNLKG